MSAFFKRKINGIDVKALKKLVHVIDVILVVIIIILFMLMFGITNLGVIMRYFFNKPIIYSVELGRYCFVSIIFIGAIFTTKADSHIHVDFFTGLFPEKVQKFMDQLGRALMAITFAVLAFYTFRMVGMNIGVKSSAMRIPMAIPYSIMAVGCVGISIECIANIILFGTGKKHKHKITDEGGVI